MPRSENPATDVWGRKFSVLLAFCLVVLLAAWLAWFWLARFFDLTGAEGQYGDPFGILTALFTGLTLVTIAIALFQFGQETQRAEDARLDAERARLDNAEDLGRLFFEPELAAIRNDAFAARIGWFKESFNRAAFARFWIDSEHLVVAKMPEDGNGAELKHAEGLPDPGPTSRLIDYYVSLFHRLRWLPDDGKSQELKQELVQRYLWPYWRGYLLQLSETVWQEREKWVSEHPQMAGQ